MSYNQESAQKRGWKPSWFGCSTFGPELKEAIKQFQRERRLKVDGYCGQTTFDEIVAVRAFIDNELVPESPEGKDYIIIRGRKCPINWGRVVTWDEEGGMPAPDGTYNTVREGLRDVKMFVNHWDVCLSAKQCYDVLKNRGISVHFLIDNDGTIYQTMDANDIAWHAGSRKLNNLTIGVEISNAFYPKYQGWYEKWFGARPVITNATLNGKKIEKHLGFYDIQKEAAKALWEAIAAEYNIPLQTPTKSGGSELAAFHKGASEGTYRGIVHHYNLTTRKTDCAGFDLTEYVGN